MVGDRIILFKPGLQHKLSALKSGLRTILSVAKNGTLKIKGGSVQERLNIRRIEHSFEEFVNKR
jgi:hypothetical protein